MQKFIKIILAIVVLITAGAILNAASNSTLFQTAFKDSRIHSLDLEEHRVSPRQH